MGSYLLTFLFNESMGHEKDDGGTRNPLLLKRNFAEAEFIKSGIHSKMLPHSVIPFQLWLRAARRKNYLGRFEKTGDYVDPNEPARVSYPRHLRLILLKWLQKNRNHQVTLVEQRASGPVGQNCTKSTHSIYRNKPLSHELESE